MAAAGEPFKVDPSLPEPRILVSDMAEDARKKCIELTLEALTLHKVEKLTIGMGVAGVVCAHCEFPLVGSE